MVIRATSEVDRKLSELIEVEYGGYLVTDVNLAIESSGTDPDVGAEVKLRASIFPDLAEQKVTWSVDDPQVGSIVAEDDLSATVKIFAGGLLIVTATAAAGSNASKQKSITTPIKVNTFILACARTALDISETAVITATFDPPEAKCKLLWSVNDHKLGSADGGKFIPLVPGNVTVTALVPGSKLQKTIIFSVIVEPTRTVTIANLTVSLDGSKPMQN